MSRNPDSIADELLVLACQSGDGSAFDALYRRWQRRLAAHARRLCGDRDLAADVLQESWISILRGLRGIADPACFRAWAYGVVAHKAADGARRTSRQQRLEHGAAPPDVATPPAPGPEADERGALRLALRALPPTDRAVLSLFYLDELTVGEIAESMSIPRGTVKSRLFHARKRLRRAFERRTS